MSTTKNVKIVKSNGSRYWYADKIGETFEVELETLSKYRVKYTCVDRIGRFIDLNDCEDVTEPFLFQGYPLVVGDKLWSIPAGWVTVTKISPEEHYPIEVGGHTFKADGKIFVTYNTPSLFWDEIAVPKKPVAKTKVYKVLYKWRGNFFVSDDSYQSLAAFEKAHATIFDVVQLILESETEVGAVKK